MARIRSFGALALGGGIAAFTIYAAYFGQVDISYTRGLIVWASVICCFLTHPLSGRYPAVKETQGLGLIVNLIDLLLMAVITAAVVNYIRASGNANALLVMYNNTDVALGLSGVLVLLEATRRLFGLPLLIFIAVTLAYAIWGDLLPGFMGGHTGFTMNAITEMVWFGNQGVFGTPLGIVIQVVLIYIIFGLILDTTGAANSLIKVALFVTGRTRGGSGHAAMVASAMFGSMSGSVVANVVGTGAFTIPMMVRRGFKPASAAAIEAAASTGGQIMPPVMGAAAFLMSDLLGMNYLTICVAAILPALLYYGGLFIAVSLDAARSGIEPVPAHEREKVDRATLLNCLMFVLPIIAIVLVLVAGRTPSVAGFYAVVVAIVAGLIINPDMRRNPQKLIRAIIDGGRSGTTIVVAVAAIGVILGTLNLTGIGLSFASTVAALGKDSLFLALLLTAATCLLLGMGMPTLPAYLVIVLVMGRSLRELGIDPLAVHLFVFYFGVLSAITPPVAVAIFAASPIAGAHPFGASVAAVRMAFVGFIIPFVFVTNPSLLLVLDGFNWIDLVIGILTVLSALWALSTAAAGYDSRPIGPGRRLFRCVLGIAPVVALVGNHWPNEVVVVSVILLLVDSIAVRRFGSSRVPQTNTE